MKLRRFAFALLVALFALAGSVRLLAGRDAPKQYDPKLFQELRWRLIGPSRGGRVLAVTGVRGQPEIFYFGSVAEAFGKRMTRGERGSPSSIRSPLHRLGRLQ